MLVGKSNILMFGKQFAGALPGCGTATVKAWFL